MLRKASESMRPVDFKRQETGTIRLLFAIDSACQVGVEAMARVIAFGTAAMRFSALAGSGGIGTAAEVAEPPVAGTRRLVRLRGR